jgi:hypothetical protein
MRPSSATACASFVRAVVNSKCLHNRGRLNPVFKGAGKPKHVIPVFFDQLCVDTMAGNAIKGNRNRLKDRSANNELRRYRRSADKSGSGEWTRRRNRLAPNRRFVPVADVPWSARTCARFPGGRVSGVSGSACHVTVARLAVVKVGLCWICWAWNLGVSAALLPGCWRC